MRKKEFVIAALEPEYEIFVVHVASFCVIASLNSNLLDIYLSRKSQIVGLIAKKAFTKVSVEYTNFVNIFFPDLMSELLEHTRINDYAIKLVDGQQPSYRPIYSLRLVKLKTLKTYIETNLANGFIKPSKSPANTLIFFSQKLD